MVHAFEPPPHPEKSPWAQTPPLHKSNLFLGLSKPLALTRSALLFSEFFFFFVQYITARPETAPLRRSTAKPCKSDIRPPPAVTKQTTSDVCIRFRRDNVAVSKNNIGFCRRTNKSELIYIQRRSTATRERLCDCENGEHRVGLARTVGPQ